MTGCWQALAFGMLSLLGGVCGAEGGGTQTRTVQDPIWGMTAETVTMPTGWKFDGIVSHGETCVSTVPDIRYAAESRDGSVEVQYFPEIRYSYSNNPQANQQNQGAGCLITQYVKPEDFLTHVVAPAMHPGMRFEVHPLPDMSDMAKERAAAEENDRRLSQRGTMSHTEVRMMLLGFDSMRGGVHTLEGFIGRFHCTQTNYGNTHLQTMECQIEQAIDLRAPETQMQSMLSAGIVHATQSPAWVDRAKQMLDQRFAGQNAQMQTMFQRDQQALIAQHKMLMDNQNAQFDAGQKRAKTAEDARHAGAVGTANSMGDLNDYRDPATGKVYKVSNQYSHTYLDSMGKTIVQTNSAYAPGPDTVWQELQPHN